jgi:hypothetical protein
MLLLSLLLPQAESLLTSLFRLLDPNDTGMVSLLLLGECLRFDKLLKLATERLHRNRDSGNVGGANSSLEDDSEEVTLPNLVRALKVVCTHQNTIIFDSETDGDVGRCVWAALRPPLWSVFAINFATIAAEKGLLDENYHVVTADDNSVYSKDSSITWGEVKNNACICG